MPKKNTEKLELGLRPKTDLFPIEGFTPVG